MIGNKSKQLSRNKIKSQNNNKLYKVRMYSCPVPNSEILLQQLIRESGITNKQEQNHLKQQFKRKLSHHINLVQYHRLREDRFILSQKKVLQKQNISIQKTKEYLDLKQRRANINKTQNLKDMGKRMEGGLNKWEKTVKRNKEEHQMRIKHSESLIKDWNDKLSESSSRKSLVLSEFAKHLKERSQEKEKKVSTFRMELDQRMLKNPEQYQKVELERHERYVQSLTKHDTRKSSRVSTESIFDKKKKQEEDYLQKSLLTTVNKEQRINEARHIKLYLQQRKKKQRIEKEEMIQRMRQNNLNSIKNTLEERNQILDQKYKNSRVKTKNKSSLPQIQGSKAINLLLHGPGEEWRKRERTIHHHSDFQLEVKTSKNYDRLIMEKLKDVSKIMRKNRQIQS